MKQKTVQRMKNDSTSRQNDEKQSLRQMLIEIYDTLFPADCFFSEKQQRIRRYLFSFGTPMVLMMMVYCSIGAWPIVGPNSPLVLDMNGQYVYFFANLRNIMLDDNSLLYSWSRSLGGEFLGMYAYYLASPISWIVVLFPADMITEAIWVMLVLKTGICGFTMSVFLDKAYPSKSLNIVLFSTLYAFCAYNLAYMSNIMWMDGVMLLPLLMFGLEKLLAEKKYILYTLTLALIILSNYYIGFMICIFVVLYFIHYHISHGKNTIAGNTAERYYYLRSLVRVGLFSIISAAMAAVIILLAYYSLQLGKVDYGNTVHSHISIQNLTDLISKLFFGHFDTISPSGSPFVYCGILVLLTMPLFFISKRIRLREKIGSAFLLTILGVSMVIPEVDVLWHGGQAPNWMNFRYSFIFSFLLIVLAYRGLACIDEINRKILPLVSGVLIICAGIISWLDYGERYDYVETFHWNYNLFVLAANVFIVTILSIVLLSYRRSIIKSDSHEVSDTGSPNSRKRGPVICLAVCVLIEAYTAGVLQNTTLAMDVGYASRASYVDFIHTTQPAVDYIYQNDDGFYRMEKTFFRMGNDNMALDIRGVSGSTSVMNMKTLEFLQRLGYSSSSYISWYYGGNPVNDSLIGIKYIISDADGKDKQLLTEFYHMIYEDVTNDRYVFENPYSLGVAYGVHSDIVHLDSSAYRNPFDYLNAVLSAMVGQEHSVFKPMAVETMEITYDHQYPVDIHSECEHDEHHLHIQPNQQTFVCYGNGDPLYMYFNTHGNRDFSVYVNGVAVELNLPLDCSASITSLGVLDEGEKYEIVICSEYSPIIYSPDQNWFYTLDYSEFQRVVNTLQNNQLNINPESTEDRIVGTMTISEDYPILFTSIPYDKNWRIYVDGQQAQPCMIESSSDSESEKIPVLDAVVAAELTPGEHEIVIEYRSTELLIGTAISLAGVMALVAIICIEKRRKGRSSKEG